MVRARAYFAMSLGVFVFYQSMDHIHVWMVLREDEKKERLEREMEMKRVREELSQQAKKKDTLA